MILSEAVNRKVHYFRHNVSVITATWRSKLLFVTFRWPASKYLSFCGTSSTHGKRKSKFDGMLGTNIIGASAKCYATLGFGHRLLSMFRRGVLGTRLLRDVSISYMM